MKLRIRDRVILIVFSIIGICIAAGIGFAAYLYWFHGRLSSLALFDNRLYTFIIACAAAAILLILSIRVLVMAFVHGKHKDKKSVAVQQSGQGNGEVRVSMQALDALVKQSIAGHSEGVADIHTRIINHEDSISLRADMSLEADVHIPEATMLLQDSIKTYIEEYSGIAVRDISIMVSTIVPNEEHLKLPGNTNERMAIAGNHSQVLPESIEPMPSVPETNVSEEPADLQQEEAAPEGSEPAYDDIAMPETVQESNSEPNAEAADTEPAVETAEEPETLYEGMKASETVLEQDAEENDPDKSE